MSANALDIAYLAGYRDGTRTVANLTVRNAILKSMILVSAITILYLLSKE